LTPDEALLPSSISGKKQAREKRVSRRETAFTKEEDSILCSAFLNISKDPITGVNQNMDAYYKRLYNYYHEHKSEGSVQSQNSLQKRWTVIQKAVTKFCGFKSAVDRRNESGKHEYYRVNSYGTYLLVSLNSYGTCLLTCSDFKFQIDDVVKMYERTELFSFYTLLEDVVQ
jgi:hypothetical protein